MSEAGGGRSREERAGVPHLGGTLPCSDSVGRPQCGVVRWGGFESKIYGGGGVGPGGALGAPPGARPRDDSDELSFFSFVSKLAAAHPARPGRRDPAPLDPRTSTGTSEFRTIHGELHLKWFIKLRVIEMTSLICHGLVGSGVCLGLGSGPSCWVCAQWPWACA